MRIYVEIGRLFAKEKRVKLTKKFDQDNTSMAHSVGINNQSVNRVQVLDLRINLTQLLFSRAHYYFHLD